MTWVKLDDAFSDHPKVDGLSDAAFRLHVAGLCHSSRFLTDGFIEENRAPRLIRRYKPSLAAELVAAGVWHPTPDGWMVHDYTDWNPNAETVKEIQQKRADAGSKGGTKKASNRLANAKAKPVAKRKQTSSTNPSVNETPTESLPEVISPARRIAITHWEGTDPKPVLSGGFIALQKLCERFINAGHTEGEVLSALTRTRAYTLDSIEFSLNEARKPKANGQPQSAGVLDRAAQRMVR